MAVREGLAKRLKSVFLRGHSMPKASKTETSDAEQALPATYEAALSELEQLVAQLESGQMPLDQLLQFGQSRLVGGRQGLHGV